MSKIKKEIPNTQTEQWLADLCDRTFLNLWSYPSVYRDQGAGRGNSLGKEICDLLVVFKNHLIIFSDKACEFPDTGSLKKDWNRWIKRAVFKSSKQAWGAERWIRSYPDRVFINRECSDKLPVSLPLNDDIIVHRIVVAHNSEDRCSKVFGNRGNLIINSSLIGENDHLYKDDLEDDRYPLPPIFHIGRLDKNKGFVHVFDTVGMEILLSTLDTVYDFIFYLEEREKYINKDGVAILASEEDLLTIYLTNIDQNTGKHAFPEHDMIITEIDWEFFQNSKERKAQLFANKVSYLWDDIIDRFGKHALDGTIITDGDSLVNTEAIAREMAATSRTIRRSLAEALIHVINTSTYTSYSRRLMASKDSELDTAFYFVAIPNPSELNEAEYRESCIDYISKAALVVLYNFRDIVNKVIVVGTEAGQQESRSENVVLFETEWNKELENLAIETQKRLNLNFSNARNIRVEEYPTSNQEIISKSKSKIQNQKKNQKIGRNDRCPCGSGKKYKKCCL